MEEPLIKAFNCADSLQQGRCFIWNLEGEEQKPSSAQSTLGHGVGEVVGGGHLPLRSTPILPLARPGPPSFLARSWLFKNQQQNKTKKLKVRPCKSPLINCTVVPARQRGLHLVTCRGTAPLITCPWSQKHWKLPQQVDLGASGRGEGMPAHSSFPHPLASLKDREKSRPSGIYLYGAR